MSIGFLHGFLKKKHQYDESKKIRDINNWNESSSQNILWEWEDVISDVVFGSDGHRIDVPGYCDVCDKDVKFILDDRYSDIDPEHPRVVLRERMVCPECGLNTRQRALFKILPDYVNLKSKIYMLEQVTPPFRAVNEKYSNVTGSEYLGSEYKSGYINEKGIRHEDATHLSFPDRSFECVISQDVFEHVFDIASSLKEMYRVLMPKGHLIISIPFYSAELKTRRRAEIINGEINYLLDPQYHGNPMGGGSLVVYDYGWDLLDMIRSAGFSDVYIRKEYSPSHGIIGVDSIFFIIARK